MLGGGGKSRKKECYLVHTGVVEQRVYTLEVHSSEVVGDICIAKSGWDIPSGYVLEFMFFIRF